MDLCEQHPKVYSTIVLYSLYGGRSRSQEITKRTPDTNALSQNVIIIGNLLNYVHIYKEQPL